MSFFRIFAYNNAKIVSGGFVKAPLELFVNDFCFSCLEDDDNNADQHSRAFIANTTQLCITSNIVTVPSVIPAAFRRLIINREN